VRKSSRSTCLRVVLASAVAALVFACGAPEEERPAEGAAAAPAQPAAPARNDRRDAYFGDLHVHTSYSIDSYIFGNRLDPRDAYRFARGESVTLHGGATQKLSTPLDFAAVTDHAEGLEIMALCVDDEASPQYTSAFCTGIRDGDMAIFRQGFVRLSERPPVRFEVCEAAGVDCKAAARGPWQEIQRIAEEFNEPGRFTTLIGFEHSPTLVDGGMLHRNVVFRGSAVTDQAMGVWDVHTQADFWRWLEGACTGECQALAIPHNSNYSWGLMFADSNDDGRAYTREDWERRVRVEPLVEVTQHKGSSECAIGLGASDEECAFEQIFKLCKEGQTTGCARPGSFIRAALERGLELEDEVGVNPFKLGFIGSTDTHNALAGGTEESTFLGHHANNDDTTDKRLRGGPRPERPNLIMNPGGLAGVWAESNTREDIFDALRRRETFATSGTRLRVRFFGGFGFDQDLAAGDAALERAYAQGVPMGGDLRAPAAAAGAESTAAPRFLVWALKDPAGASLDRVQVIKGWVGESGAEEAVYDVACADGRTPEAATGRCAATAATVDQATCEPSTGSGAAELSTVWTDPSFDPARRAFYYVRVLENPTCRWSSWEALRAAVEPPPNVPRTIQERAWSSPIWFSP
jgi:hypothetical protein